MHRVPRRLTGTTESWRQPRRECVPSEGAPRSWGVCVREMGTCASVSLTPYARVGVGARDCVCVDA